jgi:gluconolactonase
MSFRTSDFTVVASELQYPESPIWLSDGSLLVVEIKAKTLLRFRQKSDGSFRADDPIKLSDPTGTLDSGPNGAAIGRDGCVYIANDGGKKFLELRIEGKGKSWNLNVAEDAPSSAYRGGYIQRVNLDTKEVEIWCAPDSVKPADEKSPAPKLSSPDDIVFDSTGGFWFTDWGNKTGRSREITGIYYVPQGSRTPEERIPGRSAPNGIGLSPAGDRLYVSETYNRWVVFWELELARPGELKERSPKPPTPTPNILSGQLHKASILDSLRLDEEGNVYVATMLPEGENPIVPGGITVLSPKGETLDYIELPAEFPEPLPSSLCFGGPDRRTAFITCAGTGRILSCRMRIPGLRAAFEL